MRTKICGITNLEDALYACECGADALGFIFYKPSPRYIPPLEAKKIIKKLPPFVKTVGLFVNEEPVFINETGREIKTDLAQIHFEVTKDFLDALTLPALPVVRAKSKKDLERFADRYRIVDSFCESYGGSGKRLNLEWFEGMDCSKTILAGGLNADNVAQTKTYGFYAVDVSSGVEKTKGKKDLMKVRQFIDNAKEC